VKALSVDAPFIVNPRGVRYGIEVPAAIASIHGSMGTPTIRLVMNTQHAAAWRNEGSQVCNFVSGTASIELNLFSRPTYDGRVGLGETVRRETMAGKAVSDPQNWLTEMIAVAQANALLNRQAAHNTFVDPMISIFHQQHIRYAHPDVREKGQIVMDKWEKMRTDMGGMAKGGRDAKQVWRELERLLQQTLAEVKQIDQTVIDIHLHMHESTTWRKLFQVRKEVNHPEIDSLQVEAHGIIKNMGISLAAYSLVLITTGADKKRHRFKGSIVMKMAHFWSPRSGQRKWMQSGRNIRSILPNPIFSSSGSSDHKYP
jgi:hypothetical protein